METYSTWMETQTGTLSPAKETNGQSLQFFSIITLCSRRDALENKSMADMVCNDAYFFPHQDWLSGILVPTPVIRDQKS